MKATWAIDFSDVEGESIIEFQKQDTRVQQLLRMNEPVACD